MTGWLLPLGALLGGVIALEALARSLLRKRGSYYVFPPGRRLELRVDLEQAPGLDAVARFEINRDGERGPDPPRGRRDCYRVLTCGGSAAEGFLLDEPRSWAGALRAGLSSPEALQVLGASSVHVGSLGRSRTGAQALDLIFEKTLARYARLDAVVIMVGATDVVEWFEAGAPEHWRPPEVTVPELFAEHPECAFGWVPTRWALSTLLRRQARRVLRPKERRAQAGSTLARVRAMRAAAREIISEIPEPHEMLERFGLHLARALKRLRHDGRRVLVLAQPCFDRNHTPEALERFWDFGVGNPYHEEVTRYFKVELAGRVMGQMNARAREVADQQDAEFLDLSALIEPSLEIYYDFLHFTPKGAALVGSHIARKLLSPRVPGS